MENGEPNVELRTLESYSGRLLVRAAAARARWKLASLLGARHSPLAYQEYEASEEFVLRLPGIDVLGRSDLSGGGPGYIAGYFRELLGLPETVPCERAFEFCAGPGYIGYSLLAAGFCRTLTLADVNPESVDLARRTAERAGIADRVSTYVSDGLEQIPADESWDLVVGNPPHYLPERPPRELPRGLDTTSIIYFDPDWRVHRDFYGRVKQFMRPGGLVVMLEDGDGSTAADFTEMISAGGGEFVAAPPERDLHGQPTTHYYVISRW